MKIKDTNASYYEKHDLSDMMIKNSGKKKVNKTRIKRITINITDKLYNEAHELDSYMGMGYQNVLKTAITLGLRDLHEILKRDKEIRK